MADIFSLFIVLKNETYEQKCEVWLHSDKLGVPKGSPLGHNLWNKGVVVYLFPGRKVAGFL